MVEEMETVINLICNDDDQMTRFLILLLLSRNKSLEASELGRLIRPFGTIDVEVPRMLLLMQDQGEVYWRPDGKWSKGLDPRLAKYANMPGH